MGPIMLAFDSGASGKRNRVTTTQRTTTSVISNPYLSAIFIEFHLVPAVVEKTSLRRVYYRSGNP
jgi:hypothetical protein